VLEPQSTVLFALLILGFGGLMYWMVRTRRIYVRVVAAVLAFALAMQVGILAVNKYFDYYPTWGAAITDLTGSGSNVAQVSDTKLVAGGFGKAVVPTPVNRALAEAQGFTFQVVMAGKLSHISRLGLVYLPPQYFQSAYRNYKFPVIELIHGQPGTPEDWIDVAGITATLDQLMNAGLARPVVLVMPDADGGQRVSLQCLNVHNGPQDLTYLAQDVPADIMAMLGNRIEPPGLAWGIAGYSEGGYCAANMALHFRGSYGFAGVLSGYFSPLLTDVLVNGKAVDPFGDKRQLYANTPLAEVRSLSPGEPIPQFWLGAGANAPPDVQAADYFAQLLALHQVVPPVHTSPGGHSMGVWRSQIPPMLEWMTDGLTSAAAILHRHLALASHHHLMCRPSGTGNGRLLASRTPTRGQHTGSAQSRGRSLPYRSCQRGPAKDGTGKVGTGKKH
jgi:S-formylglutathione hydrolase FrmB